MQTRGMVETVTGTPEGDALADAAQLLHDFNVEYDEPVPPPRDVAVRLGELIEDEDVVALLARDPDNGAPVGVAVMRVQP